MRYGLTIQHLIKSILIFLRKNREKIHLSFLMLAQPEKVMTASQKKLKTQREQYHVMYQGKGRFEHSRFILKNMSKLLISS